VASGLCGVQGGSFHMMNEEEKTESLTTVCNRGSLWPCWIQTYFSTGTLFLNEW
jgi:hypothetical protein